MILVDTSVWIDHLNEMDPVLERLLKDKQVLCHPFVIGELAMGSMRNRDNFLRAMQRLPKAMVARHTEVLHLISAERLFALGLGYADMHLVSFVRLTAMLPFGRAMRGCLPWPAGSTFPTRN